MTKSRSVAIGLAIQVIALLSLSQPWFTISMLVDGSQLGLGAFDGSKSFASTSPLALLSLAALLVAAISAAKTRLAAVVLIAISNLAALAFTMPRILSQDISALDSELDRLTGIANTHGLDTVAISVSIWPFIWATCTFAAFSFALWMLRISSRWKNEDKSKTKSASQAKPKRPSSSIDLWDDQRD